MNAYEGKAGMVYLQVKLCDPYLSALGLGLGMTYFAPRVATWWTRRNIRVVSDSAHSIYYVKNMTSSTKPEVHNVQHCRLRRIEPRPRVTCTKILVNFGRAFFWHMQADRYKQVRPSSATAVYPHMPILRVVSSMDESASARATSLSPHTNCTPGRAIHMEVREHADWPIRPIWGFWGSFWGSKVPQNGRFPAQDAGEPPCKIWRR